MMNFVEKFHPLLLAVLVIACYKNSLKCGLVFDDLAAIRDNRDVRPHTPLFNMFRNDFWGTSLSKEQSHKSYRPLTVLTFRLNYAVHGLDPFGYHLVNVILHIAVTVLFYRMCLHFLPDVSSMVASALFAVHPIHTEAVTSVVGRAEILSAFAFLGALMFYINDKYNDRIFQKCSITSCMAILGMLCKEQAITVLAVCCIYELAASAKNPSRLQSFRYLLLGRGIVTPWMKDVVLRIGLLISAAIFVISFRWKLMGSQLPVFNRFDNPAAVSPMVTRQLSHHYLLSVNAWLLLFPYYLCCDWSGSTVPLISCLWDVRNIGTLLFYAVLLWCLKITISTKRNVIPLLMSLSLLTVPFLPATNFLFPVGFVVAERVLYIPSMGFCMLVSQGWSTLWEKRLYKTLAAFGLLFLIVTHILKTNRRNEDWQSEFHLFTSALSINQRNGKLYNNMGKVLEGLDRYEEALFHYEEAIRLQPTDVRGYLNLGRVLTSLRRYHTAEEVYQKAKKVIANEAMMEKTYVSANHLQLYINLALLISRNNSRLEEADELYRQAITLRSDFSNAYLNRGDVLLKMNRTKEAEDMYHRALQIDDNNPDLYFNLGIVLMDQGRSTEALDFFNKALDINPDHEESLVLSSILIRESGMSTYNNVAKSRLEKIVHQGKESERVFINLGLMSLENKDFSTAEMWFRKALHIKPNSRAAIFNLALLLSEQRQPEESLVLLTKLLQFYPNHVNGLILMADIYVSHLKNLDAAEECYLKVLEVEPQNPKALHNLCVLYVERQNLKQAEQCFLHATTIHPTFDYMQKHLEITRNLLKQKGVELSSTQLRSSHPSVLESLATPSIS